MKKLSVFLLFLIISWSFLAVTADAKSVFYSVEAKGGLFVHGLDGEVLKRSMCYNRFVYYFNQKVWTDKPCNLNLVEGVRQVGKQTEIKYNFPFGSLDKDWTGWVVSKYLKRVKDLRNIRFIIPLAGGFNVIWVHKEPGYFSDVIGQVHVNGGWRKGAVLITGRIINGWVEILYRKSYFTGERWVVSKKHIFPGWIWGEYIGVVIDSKYKKFDQPRIYQTLGWNVKARAKPIITSKNLGTYQRKGFRVKIIGEKGGWLLTDKGKWVFKELLRRVSD